MKKVVLFSFIFCFLAQNFQTFPMFSGWSWFGSKKESEEQLPKNIENNLKQLTEEFNSLEKAIEDLAQGKYANVAKIHIANITKLIDSQSTLFQYARRVDPSLKQLLRAKLEKINEQYKELLKQITQVAQLKTMTFEELTSLYKDNFANVLESIPNFTPEKVYELLGFSTIKEGQDASFTAVKVKLDEQKDMMEEKLYRQVKYVFDNELAKKKYDTYLNGRAALLELQKNLNQATVIDLQAQMMQIGLLLTDLLEKTREMKPINITTKNGKGKK